MKDNEHLGMRQQFYVRMADKILKNTDTAYTFMGVVCETVSITDLPIIETVFISRVNQTSESRNWGKNGRRKFSKRLKEHCSNCPCEYDCKNHNLDDMNCPCFDILEILKGGNNAR